ncbi:MAG: acyl-CoA dehydrogenase family protein, partial [Microthrixaceae bacterium]
GLGLLMAAPTILTHGTPEQQERLVPPILRGQAAWCQLFSEPGAGSDLAGVTTRAERDGDRWIVNGQKVWSSMAMGTDRGMLVARTSFDVPKHEGLSWFAFDMDQPGVTVRPLREMTGQAVFNEVFLDDVVCTDADLIGAPGDGWRITQTTLFFERTGIGAGGAHSAFPGPGAAGGMLGRRAGEAAGLRPPVSKLTLTYDDVERLARSQGRTTDPHVRQQLARLYSFSRTGNWNALRGKAEAEAGTGGAVANVGKISQTRIVKTAAHLAADILGSDAMLIGPDGVEGGIYSEAVVFSPASSIYGGTDEIQRNIISERVLGMPREPNPDKGRPYGEVLRGRAAGRQGV